MTGKACIFMGPTLPAEEARFHLDATYLPPARQGDVYRASLTCPAAIGIIDGYFQFTPAIRHKEILWAMSRGIHVFGSASMGALRAAELAVFGMEGVGRVFELYRDGLLEDDDEVALVHAPAEMGYRPISEAMVNIRLTLLAASHTGVIAPGLQVRLEKIAKGTYYPNRTYPALLKEARRAGLPEGALVCLEQWLPTGQVDQKRQDATLMLQLMHDRLREGLGPKEVTYSFEHTLMWDSALRQCQSRSAEA